MLTADILKSADFIGISSFALSGFLAGAKKRLDIFGVVLLAFMTALGGGIARDVVVGQIPLSMRDFMPSEIVILTLGVSLILRLHKTTELDQKLLFVLSDAIGLCAFSISGSIVALSAGLNVFGVSVLALLTAVGGGMLRDMLVNEVPTILKSEVYATISILIAILICLLDYIKMFNLYTTFILFCSAFVLRMVAYTRNWHLPTLG